MSKPGDKGGEYFLIAPAKVNLILDVDDHVTHGRHGVTTVMQAVSLCDHLHVKVGPSDSQAGSDGKPDVAIRMVDAHGLGNGDIALQDNLVYRAIEAYGAAIGQPLACHIDITLEKGIPPQSGLGGGSSDCAAIIALMSLLHGRDPLDDVALAVASQLGTDIAFFLHGGCALLDGYGERFVEALPVANLDVVIARPLQGLCTRAVYQGLDSLNRSTAPGQLEAARQAMAGKRRSLIGALRQLQEGTGAEGGQPHVAARMVAGSLGNTLQQAAFAIDGQLEDMHRALLQQPGIEAAMLSGSGSALFAVCQDEQAAERACDAMRQRGLWSVTCKTVSFGAGVADSLASL